MLSGILPGIPSENLDSDIDCPWDLFQLSDLLWIFYGTPVGISPWNPSGIPSGIICGTTPGISLGIPPPIFLNGNSLGISVGFPSGVLPRFFQGLSRNSSGIHEVFPEISLEIVPKFFEEFLLGFLPGFLKWFWWASFSGSCSILSGLPLFQNF